MATVRLGRACILAIGLAGYGRQAAAARKPAFDPETTLLNRR